MLKPIKRNRNLHAYTGEDFKGLPYYKERGAAVYEYLERILETLNKSLNEHPRTLAIRIDLRYPSTYSEEKREKLISSFIKALRGYFRTDYNCKLARNVRAHRSSIRYVSCRESTEYSSEHYHMMLFINHDAYFKLGAYGMTHQNLANMIRTAWAAALGVDVSESSGAVHFPKKCLHHVRENTESFAKDYADAFFRASYLAKLDTKAYGNGYRSFSSSNI